MSNILNLCGIAVQTAALVVSKFISEENNNCREPNQRKVAVP